MFIGNFIHEPNYQTVVVLKKYWNKLRKRLPKTELHIYGAYPPQKVVQLHYEKERFIVNGQAGNRFEAMKNYRVLTAPIPCDAGLRGKCIVGFRSGLLNVTSKVGAEAIIS